jgi:hypothetical protein
MKKEKAKQDFKKGKNEAEIEILWVSFSFRGPLRGLGEGGGTTQDTRSEIEGGGKVQDSLALSPESREKEWCSLISIFSVDRQ